jgi:hypothetical protein
MPVLYTVLDTVIVPRFPNDSTDIFHPLPLPRDLLPITLTVGRSSFPPEPTDNAPQNQDGKKDETQTHTTPIRWPRTERFDHSVGCG